jgi:hypothetical protein
MPTDPIWTFQISILVPHFGLMHRSKRRTLLHGYSITSSARASKAAKHAKDVYGMASIDPTTLAKVKSAIKKV